MSLVLAAKVTHIPRMVLSELPGPLHGCRQDAIDGLRLIGDRIVQAGADTVVILDTHWLSNAAYHVNAHDTFQGVFQSTEFPTQIESLEFDHAGVIVSFQQIDTVAADQAVASPMRRLGM